MHECSRSHASACVCVHLHTHTHTHTHRSYPQPHTCHSCMHACIYKHTCSLWGHHFFFKSWNLFQNAWTARSLEREQ
jgi:hypothetical protein